MNAAVLQMSAKLSELAHDARVDSQWKKLADEAGLSWREAAEMTFRAFCARLAEKRLARGAVRA